LFWPLALNRIRSRKTELQGKACGCEIFAGLVADVAWESPATGETPSCGAFDAIGTSPGLLGEETGPSGLALAADRIDCPAAGSKCSRAPEAVEGARKLDRERA